VTGPTGKVFGPGRGRYWRQNEASFKDLDRDGRIWWGEDGGNMPRLKRFLSEVREGVVPQTLLLHTQVGNTQEAKKELLEYAGFEETINVLNSVKPTRLLRHIIRIATDSASGDIAVDFFAGSGPLGHAIMLQNAEDSGNRRYLLVQLPEPLPIEEKAVKTIADLAKERLRRAAKKIRDETPMFAGDTGFRVFKLDSTNIREWEPDRDNLEKTLLDHIEHIKTGRTEADILYELLLKLGLDLCVPIEKRTIAGKAVHSIGREVLMTCLAEKIRPEDVEAPCPRRSGMAQVPCPGWRHHLCIQGQRLCR